MGTGNHTDTAPAGAALMVVYRHYVTLNRRAMSVLGITVDAPYVCFGTSLSGRVTIAGTASPSGHHVRIRNYSGRVSSTSLARWLGRQLQGCGTYRIQEEYKVCNLYGEQQPCYEIFIRKYQNQRDYADKTETGTAAGAPVAGHADTPEI